jgi:phage I-like protein
MSHAGEQGPAQTATMGEDRERVLIQSALPEEQTPPSRVLVAPWGEVRSLNGEFVIDEEAARAVVESFRSHGTDIPIDYEHQSLGGQYASPTGLAPAAGWIRGLQVVSSAQADEQAGLFAEVEWTEEARRRLAAKEYRYLSPVVLVRKSDRRAVALHSVALTNKPAIVGMKPLINREDGSPEDESNLRDAGADVLEVVDVLRCRLGLPQGSGARDVLIAAEARLISLVAESVGRAADDKVDAAMKAGKLAPAQREWATSLAMKDPQAFDDWLATAPVVVKPGRINSPTGDSTESQRRAAVIASARATFRAESALSLITTEAAWVQDALREAGLSGIDV